MQSAEGANPTLVREMFAEGNRVAETGRFGSWLGFYSEEIVWEAVEDAPDAGTYRGHEGIRGYFEDWLGTLDSIHWEVRDITELGASLVVDLHAVGRIKGTDGEVALDYSQAMLIEDGKITRIKEFRDHDDAIAYARETLAAS